MKHFAPQLDELARGAITLVLSLTALSLSGADYTTLNDRPSSLTGDVSANYSRSTAHPDTADFHESTGFALTLIYKPRPFYLVTVKSGFDRAFDVESEKFRPGNTSVSFSPEVHALTEDRLLTFAATASLPTDHEGRDFLYYRGSLGGSLSLSESFAGSRNWLLRPLSLRLASSLNRNFFAYDSNRSGSPNTLWAFVLGVDTSYQLFGRLSAGAGISNTRSWKANGGPGTDVYGFSLGLAYQLSPSLSIGLSQTTSDRTFGYDRVSPNLALYDSRLTALVASLSYHL